MMRHGHCPQCNGNDIRISAVKIPVPAYAFIQTIPIAWSFWGGLNAAPLTTYICVRCGYVESYIEDREKLAEIAATLPRMMPTSPQS